MNGARGKTVTRTASALISLTLVVGFIAGCVGLVVTGELGSGLEPIYLPALTIAAKVAEYLALTLAFGYVFTLTLLQPGAGRTRGDKSPALTPEQRRQSSRAFMYTVVFVMLLGVSTYSAYANATGSLDPANFGYFLSGTELGTISLCAGSFAIASAVIGAFTRRLLGAGWQGALLALTVVALGFLGHAGSSLDHANAVNAMIVHLLGLVTWLGPLVVMVHEWSRSTAAHAATIVRRYSPWALFAILALAFSGLINALLRLDSIAELVTTGYGQLVTVKLIGTCAIAVLGYVQRERVVRALPVASAKQSSTGSGTDAVPADVGRLFSKLARTEATIAALIIGVSAALGRSEPPVPQYTPPEEYRVLSLVGFEAPTAIFDVPTLFTEWQIDWVFLATALLFAGLYLAGMRRLHKRGDAWPLHRAAFWLAGCAAFILVMNAGPAAYGRVRFDAHMVQHMALMIIVPPLWVLGAPVTLISRAVTPRNDGSRGIREWILAILHSGYATVVSSPPVAGFLFAGSLVIFYFTPLFTWAMFEHAGHLIMTIHFLLAGYLFAWVIMGIDPAQKPINPVLKLVTLLATLSFHAFFGIAVVSASWIIGGDWYSALHMFGREELEFLQVRGGSIMWGVSEVPTVLYAIAAAVLWTKSDERKARQYDRKAAKDGDAELAAYNEYLRSICDNH